MISYAIYAVSNPCGNIIGRYISDERSGWSISGSYPKSGMDINTAYQKLVKQRLPHGLYPGIVPCQCIFEVVEIIHD
jgi:hypothetical protein